MRQMLAVCLLLALGMGAALAGPVEEATAVVEHWSALYNAGDSQGLVDLYAPDAIFFGTTAATAMHGSQAIKTYFAVLGQGNRRNAIVENNGLPLADNAVLVTGFYDFSRSDNSAPPQPARFTMVLVKREGRWLILHHHSSPRGRPAQ